MCGADRVVCLIDPVGDVCACPFAIHENFLARNLRTAGGFEAVWRDSALFAELRGPSAGGACGSCQFYDSCRGGCTAAKLFTRLPLDGPDRECVRGFGEQALAERAPAEQALAGADRTALPRPGLDHSHRGPVRAQVRRGQARPPVP
jgi:mycofactocin biosynthetic radical S-adenosylmethionine protein MftC